MGRGRWRQGVMVAGLLLAACAQRPAPRPTIEDVAMAEMMPSFLCLQHLAPRIASDLKLPLDQLMECSDHANRALDILAVRCKALPPATELPEDAVAPALQSRKPASDELLVHLCAVFPWQDRPQRLRML